MKRTALPYRKAVRQIFFGGENMNGAQKKLLKETLVCGGILAAYYFFVRLTGLSIPCVFYEVTGLKCPGCGLTAMCVHLAHFRFGEALRANPLMFFFAPVLMIMLALRITVDPKWLDGKSKPYKIAVWVLLGVVMVYWVMRNVMGF